MYFIGGSKIPCGIYVVHVEDKPEGVFLGTFVVLHIAMIAFGRTFDCKCSVFSKE